MPLTVFHIISLDVSHFQSKQCYGIKSNVLKFWELRLRILEIAQITKKDLVPLLKPTQHRYEPKLNTSYKREAHFKLKFQDPVAIFTGPISMNNVMHHIGHNINQWSFVGWVGLGILFKIILCLFSLTNRSNLIDSLKHYDWYFYK